MLPGLNRLYYNGDYWPESIESITDRDLLGWIEERLWLVPLSPRHAEYDVLADTHINESDAQRLSQAAEACWQALKAKNVIAWGKAASDSFEAQVAMFPNMIISEVSTVSCVQEGTSLMVREFNYRGMPYTLVKQETGKLHPATA